MTIKPIEFRYLLDLYMVSDPWPLEDKKSHKIIGDMLDEISKAFGSPDWVAAYHEFQKGAPPGVVIDVEQEG